MEKQTKRYKKFLLYKSNKEILKRKKYKLRKKGFAPFEVKMWDGVNNETALCTKKPFNPPSCISLVENTDQTLIFLKHLRDRLGRKIRSHQLPPTWVDRRGRTTPVIKSFVDFSMIEDLSVSCALVIASIYDRAKRITGLVPPAINYEHWHPAAFQVFYEIGLFSLIGYKNNHKILETYQINHNPDVKIIKAISGVNANGLGECSKEIQDLLGFLTGNQDISENFLPDINTAISEAMINVAKHAYSDAYVLDSPYDTVKQWWMTARADRRTAKLTIVVYDQGETIPGTLPYKSSFQKAVVGLIRQTVNPSFVYSRQYHKMDHEYINYSMKPGRTQTEDRQRGLGLPQMQDLINRCPGGRLTIVSRAGLYIYGKGTGVHKRALPLDLEGTLIEWHLTLPTRGVA